ncbi:carbohydrate ABC transporter permease [Acidaminobacter sp. JC074]|uniref:carbohydrate ABC transporter permease n=1 Tax=Acidaminobacter sp. JC074 TaxID=2530199 RepID=UPI001F10C750|nr:carbohydrate ABC transporter permease [Acidaminobacter sp. JC074]MCH4889650.1 carbohydrate ABC transporter permease [Acidaminobacter sp. JC074]
MKKRLFRNNFLVIILLTLFGIVMLSPFAFMVSLSLERYANIQPPFPPRFIPEVPSLFNYKLVFENGKLFHAYLNSFITTSCSVLLNVSSALLAGYAFSKGQFKGKKMLFYMVIATMMIPMQVRLIPMHKMFLKVGMLNTFLPIILPNILYGFGVMLCKQYFDNLPDSLGESAAIDGAGKLKTFFKIYLPLTGPITATMVILSFMDNWNAFLWPLVVLSDQKLHTVPIFLSRFVAEDGGRFMGLTMALASASILPILIVFLALQRYIIESIALSGLKGE